MSAPTPSPASTRSEFSSYTDVDWENWEPRDRATLLFVMDAGRLLLIRKKRGLGAGKITGPGGHIEPGESPAEAAVRELEEELEAARAARATAEAGVATATAEATGIVDAARVDATALRDAAEVEIRRAAEDARNQMMVEISELEHCRDDVLEQVEVTAAHLVAHRTRLHRAVADLSALVDGVEDRPEGVGFSEVSNVATSEAGMQAATVLRPTARPDARSRSDAVIERTSSEPSLPEPDWAGEVEATEVVRPLRLGNAGMAAWASVQALPGR